MSVTVRHLNADSTFLLTFSPEPHPRQADLKRANGAFTILVDPFLAGSSIVLAPWFAITRHNVPSAIEHLSQIEEPDVVIVSQNKPDHCHKETLLQLRSDARSIIAAEPGAAKAIKSWKYFDPDRVYGLSKFDGRSRYGNSLRLNIPPLSVGGCGGEICITFIAAKHYMTGLHNAFGITYQPPTHHQAIASVPTIEIPRGRKYFHPPHTSTSPATLVSPSSPSWRYAEHMRSKSLDFASERTNRASERSQSEKGDRPRLSRATGTQSSEALPLSELNYIYRHFHHNAPEPPNGQQVRAITPSFAHFDFALNVAKPNQACILPDFDGTRALPTPPASPTMFSIPSTDSTITLDRVQSPVLSDSVSWRSTATDVPPLPAFPTKSFGSAMVVPGRPKALSILYTPHGIAVSDLEQYIQQQLVKLPGALPLTLLLHSFDHAQNPWYLGGNVMYGAAGGIKIAQSLMARCWLSAHDEAKDDRGLAVKKLKVRRMQPEEVMRQMWTGDEGRELRQLGWSCDVRSLGVGRELTLRASERDLCAGMELSKQSTADFSYLEEMNWI